MRHGLVPFHSITDSIPFLYIILQFRLHTLHYIKIYITVHYKLHYIKIYIKLYYIILHYTLHYIKIYITVHYTLNYIKIYITLHYITLHCITLQLHYITELEYSYKMRLWIACFPVWRFLMVYYKNSHIFFTFQLHVKIGRLRSTAPVNLIMMTKHVWKLYNKTLEEQLEV